MKKFLFSGMMCTTFIVSGFVISQEKVFAVCVGFNPNGIVEDGEECDDGNFVEQDGCSSACKINNCGNGVKESGESCDDGNDINGDGCENDCNITFHECGNGIFEPWAEACEGTVPGCETLECTCMWDGLTESDGVGGCKAPESGDPVCGNDIIETGEQCDDGNTNNGDGCSSTCQNEITGDDDDDDDSDSDGEGDFRVKIKTYDCNGNEESTKIQGSKVKLYEKDGDKADEDKTNFKGEANFYDIEEGKYYVKCEVLGYVSLKDRSKDYYKSGTEKVEDGKRAKETCHLIKSSCDSNVKVEKLAQTGGSLKDLVRYVFNLVF